jgi:hypothetical protein
MPSFFPPFFSLLGILRSPALHLWLKVNDRGILPIGAILGLLVIYVAHYFASPYRKLPPGPRGYPIIGNLLELRSEQWLKFTKWQKKYGQFIVLILSCRWPISNTNRPGELIFLNAGGQPIIVLNSQRAAADLLDRRAAIYSDRPRLIVACDIMTEGLNFAFARYGEL